MIHGGDIQSYLEKYHKKPLDFSANISPLGVPLALKEHLIQNIDVIETYPDPLCRRLTSQLSIKHGLPSDFFLCGNGAADLIYRLSYGLKPKKALLLAPTFAEYEESLNRIPCHIDYHFLSEHNNFQLDSSFLDKLNTSYDFCVICQPNNPTGQLCDLNLMEKIIQKTKESNIFLLIDECFLDFFPKEAEYTMLRNIEDHSHLFLLKAFTKMYAIPGLRLGYIVSSNIPLLKIMQLEGQPWSVSSLAQEGGLLALNQEKYVEDVRSIIETERLFLTNALKQLGLTVFPSVVNFILFYSTSYDLTERLMNKNILIRDCSNYHGLTKGYYRIAVRSRKENEILLNTLERALKWQK